MSYSPTGTVEADFFTDASQFNPTVDVPIIPGAGLASTDSQTVLTTGPLKIGAGGTIIWPRFTAAAPAILDTCELAISNVDGTQYLDIYAGPITLTPDVERDLASTDYGTNASVGTDLTIGTDGKIHTTAGGVFWVSALIAIKTP